MANKTGVKEGNGRKRRMVTFSEGRVEGMDGRREERRKKGRGRMTGGEMERGRGGEESAD